VSERRRALPTWWIVVIGLCAGAFLGVAAAALVRDGGEDPPTMTLAPAASPYPDDQAANAQAFLAAWRRYREATFVVESTFVRELPGGEDLEVDRIVVQDPPRRLVRQGGSVSVSGDDTSMSCEPIGSETVCTTFAGVDYEAGIREELGAWATAVTGDAPAYAVAVPQPGCYDLQLVTDLVAPPYGEATRVCFDEETGAIRSRQVTRTSGIDTEEATSIRATVQDADWEVGAG
jgi:hypothetical protein